MNVELNPQRCARPANTDRFAELTAIVRDYLQGVHESELRSFGYGAGRHPQIDRMEGLLARLDALREVAP